MNDQLHLTETPFDVTGPLPQGTVLLEASAGTGKTWTIAALVTRYVAEGLAELPDLLVVTFGRAASQELRERVRERMVQVERALADPAGSADPLVGHLVSGQSADQVAERRARLTRALSDFDAATIATTHQFCQQVLTGLGIAGDTAAGTELVEDLDPLVREAVDDLYLRTFGTEPEREHRFDHRTALELGRAAVDDPQAELVPGDADPVSTANWRYRFALTIRDQVEQRKRRHGVIGYDDLLSRLAHALEDENGPAAQRMRRRWSVVLVDEFQDTDHVQWEVLRRAFHGHATLVLIGDPKQAIYAFRGGDIVTYLDAAGSADRHHTLPQNWRSDQSLVTALNRLLGDAALGDPRIRVKEVTAHHQRGRLAGLPHPEPLRLRMVRRSQLPGTGTKAKADVARPFIAADVAADIAELVASGATWDDGTGPRPLGCGDIAVLVATRKQGEYVHAALGERGLPRVMSGSVNVYTTAAGDAWLRLLIALGQPHRAELCRAAALTPLLGLTPEELGTDGEALTDEVSQTLRDWAEEFRHRGIAGLVDAVNQGRPGDRGPGALWRRVLAQPGGERLLTDLRHVAEGLARVSVADGLGLPALTEWLLGRRREQVLPGADDRARRLDSDADAVQIVTLHGSKGLEYPVVYLPFAFERSIGSEDKGQPLRLHDEHGTRQLDVGGHLENPGRSLRRRQHLAEEAGESLRLLYVGLTRAQSQVVCWWAPTYSTPAGPLHRVLLGDRTDGTIADQAVLRSEDVVAEQLKRWQDAGVLAVEAVHPDRQVPVPVPRPDTAPPRIGTFDRDIDLQWRRTSYTGLIAPGSAAAVAGPVMSEPEDVLRTDERDVLVGELPGGLVTGGLLTGGDPAADVVGGPFTGAVATGGVPAAGGALAGDSADDALRRVSSPMAQVPRGAVFGTVVHAVLEEFDPAAPDRAAHLTELCAAQLAANPMAIEPADLALALAPVLRTPLGPRLGDLAFADFGLRDRLSELTFELPLAGGDRPVDSPVLAGLVPLLRRHLAGDEYLADYPDRLLDPDLAGRALRGYLTGSIDVVLRTPDQRFVIVDHKTNWLGAGSDPDEDGLTAWHYRPAAMAAEMIHAHYPLQALLYQVALHRYLRWRLPGYDPERHLGGAVYLFLRGMCGPDTPRVAGVPTGVFDWQPPAALITEVSAFLDGGARRTTIAPGRRSVR